MGSWWATAASDEVIDTSQTAAVETNAFKRTEVALMRFLVHGARCKSQAARDLERQSPLPSL